MKKIAVLVLLFIALFVSANTKIKQVNAAPADTLVVHYHRFDSAYTGWKIWLWPELGDGGDFEFNGDDAFGKVMTFEFTGTDYEGTDSIGVIVKTASWEKDVAIDRFIDMTNPNVDNEVHVYLVSGEETIYYDDSAVDTSARASYVDFTSTSAIEFKASAAVSESQVTLMADGVPVDIENYNNFALVGSFDIVGGADLGKTYTLEIDFQEAGYDPKIYAVGFSGLYASDEFNAIYGYDGELGAIYTSTSTTFKLWAPISQAVSINLYTTGHKANDEDYDGNVGTNDAYQVVDLVKADKGVWEVTIDGDLHGVYYTYNVTNGTANREVSDPYAFSSGINGLRSMVVDFDRLDPENWDNVDPVENINSYNDAIIYELHIRDFTTHSSWNGTEAYRGKFLGLAETGTTYNGVTTGIDHIFDLGVTHVQLLPVFDFGAAVDESRIDEASYSGVKDTVFNWGYMPENFNSVEGSYSTNPYDGSVRVTEYKELIQTFHEGGVNVIMDVVYNHHGRSADSNFDLIVPGYYFRMNENGSFSNGSGTGNETASENYMMRKFMVDSVTFWAEEYKISGFRFDLMKLHDVETMNQIADAVHEIDENILIFGEPWDAGGSNLDEAIAASHLTLDEMPGVAVFNDEIRDAIKGSVFDEEAQGFIQGSRDAILGLQVGIKGRIDTYATNPNQTVNYTTAHDNNVLFDKIQLSTEGLTYTEMVEMQKQANAIVLTSNGIPFLHAGVEIMRTKPCTVIGGNAQGDCDSSNTFDHNSYRSPDQTNQIDWNWKAQNLEVFEYYKGLIELRKSTGIFSMDSAEEINSKYQFMSGDGSVVTYFITDNDSPWKYTYVIHNNSNIERSVELLNMTWNLVANQDQAGTATIEEVSGSITIRKNETLIMYVENQNMDYISEVPEGKLIIEGELFDFGLICAVDQELVDGSCVDLAPVCTIDQELVDGSCVDKAPVCADGQELVDGVCEDEPSSNTVLIIGIVAGSIAVIAGLGFIIRKKLI